MPEAKEQFDPGFQSELNIDSVISAPLVAASKANVVMVTGQTRALLDNCFNKTEDNVYEPITIRMSLVRSVIEPGETPGDSGRIATVTMHFSVPLLCLIPINNLVVNKVDVKFDLEITSVRYWPTDKGIIERQALLHGKIANTPSERNSRDSSSRLQVRIRARPLPLPLGLLSVLDLYSKAIQPLPHQPTKLDAPEKPATPDDTPAQQGSP